MPGLSFAARRRRSAGRSPHLRLGARVCRLEPLEERTVLSVISPFSESAAAIGAALPAAEIQPGDIEFSPDLRKYGNDPLAERLPIDLVQVFREYEAFIAEGGTASPFKPTNQLLHVLGGRIVLSVTSNEKVTWVDDGDPWHVVHKNTAFLDSLEAIGMEIKGISATGVSGLLPIGSIDKLADVPGIRFVTPSYGGVVTPVTPSLLSRGNTTEPPQADDDSSADGSQDDQADPLSQTTLDHRFSAEISQLYRQYQAYVQESGDPAVFRPGNPMIQFAAERVAVSIAVEARTAALLDELESLGADVAGTGSRGLDAWLPLGALENLAELAGLISVSLPLGGIVPPPQLPSMVILPPLKVILPQLPGVFTELGPVDFQDLEIPQGSAGEHWYRLEAVRDGTLTVAKFPPPWDMVIPVPGLITLFAQEGKQLVEVAEGGYRLDYATATAGQELFLRLTTGDEASQWKLANLVQVDEDACQVRFFGSGAADEIEFDVSLGHIPEELSPPVIGELGINEFSVPRVVNINGLEYWIGMPFRDDIYIDAGDEDHLALGGENGGDDHFQLGGFVYLDWGVPPRTAGEFRGDWGRVCFSPGPAVEVDGYGGSDSASLYSSPSWSDTTFVASPGKALLSWSGGECRLSGFESIEANVPTAEVHGSTGPDEMAASYMHVDLAGEGYSISVGAAHLDVYGEGGHDTAAWQGDSLYEQLTASPESVGISVQKPSTGTDWFVHPFHVNLDGFGEVVAKFGPGGNDSASFWDSPGDDVVTAGPGHAGIAYADDTVVDVYGASTVKVLSEAGDDAAYLYDSPGDDRFYATPTRARFELDGGYEVIVDNSRYVHAYATAGGTDTAYLYGDGGDDTFLATPVYGKMYGDGYMNRAKHFEHVLAYGGDGHDKASLVGSAGNDELLRKGDCTKLYGDDFFLRAKYFEETSVSGGSDTAWLVDSALDDVLAAEDNWAQLSNDAWLVRLLDFATVGAYSQNGGNDDSDVAGPLKFTLNLYGEW